MQLLYISFLFFYQFLLNIARIWNPKARKIISGRKDSFKRLSNQKKSTRNRYWFHCASLGEYDMALPLMEACVKADPQLEVYVSFYSPSGMEHYHKRGFRPTKVFYMPADFPWKIKKLLIAVGATRLYLLKYEFWPNLLKEAKNQGVEILSMSTLLRPSQIYFKWYGGFFKKALKNVNYFAVQNYTTQSLLLSAGVDSQRIKIIGDIRYNRVVSNKVNAKANRIIEQFAHGHLLLILGSSWPIEEKLSAKILKEKNLKILIAPHDLSNSHLIELKLIFPEAQFYSQTNSAELSNSKVLILDTIGHLSDAYQYGNIAFVGGGFSGKLHNILEPAAFGLPLLFGPQHQKFPEAQQFIDFGYALEIHSQKELNAALESFLSKGEDLKIRIQRKVCDLQVEIPSHFISPN